MDNQFDNYYGFEPQKPLTEKQNTEEETVTADSFNGEKALDFEPQKPLVNQDRRAEQSGDSGFNPIRHTAVYTDSSFFGAPEPFQPQQPPQPRPPFHGYYYAQPQPFYPPQPQPYQPKQEPAPFSAQTDNMPTPENSKTNKSLIVVIIVLGVLLATSLFGIVGYSIYQTDKNNKNDKNSDNPFSFFSDRSDGNENGGSGNNKNIPFTSPDTPSTTAPVVHNESYFSDKTDKNYGGMTLNNKPDDADSNKSYGAEYAFSHASGSVVSVLCYTESTENDSSPDSQGSGIILSSDGYIITNSHVIGNSKTAYIIKVITADDKEYTAGVVGFDSRTDIALLKLVDAKDLKAASFGNSDKIELGEDIIIIGNPGGIEYKNSMTKGVVSAINRDASSKSIVKYIQTDAAINPGNSGGPAVNMYGQVIGVASAKIVDEKYEGMGFCIPTTQLKEIIDSLMKNSYVDGRVKIGISGTPITAVEAQYYDVPQGIQVQSIQSGGPCDKTDLAKGDIITALDDSKITSFSEIYQVLEKHKDGDKVKLKFYRPTELKNYEIEITLQADK